MVSLKITMFNKIEQHKIERTQNRTDLMWESGHCAGNENQDCWIPAFAGIKDFLVHS